MSSDYFTETYYEVLKIHERASTSEISESYHQVKAAFSKSSVASYSVFTESETQAIVKKIDEAYRVLTNPEKRAQYDQMLQAYRNQISPVSSTSSSSLASQTTFSAPEPPDHSTSPPFQNSPKPNQNFETISIESLSGSALKDLRIKKGLTLQDVAQVTKISTRFLESIEEENLKKRPPRVYVFGFVKNLISFYRVSPTPDIAAFLDRIYSESSTTV